MINMNLQSPPDFSEYVIYVDESGSPELKTIDPKYPCFVLSFCIFKKSDYIAKVVPAVQDLKFKRWGHDAAILHTVDIKRETGDFKFLQHKPIKDAFLEELNQLLIQLPFTLVAAIIDKPKLKARYTTPHNPYDIALKFCMERSFAYLRELGQHEKQTTIIVEERGKNEDNELELEFRRIRDGQNILGEMPNFDLRFCSKKANSSGLQIADLVSTPIGRNYLNPGQSNRAYEVVAQKFRIDLNGESSGVGRKVFP